MRIRLAAVAGLACLAAAMWAVPAGSATGDKVSTVIAVRTGDACVSQDAEGNIGGVWTGIAFDGTNLVLSCWNSKNLSYVKPSDGSFVKLLAVTGADSGNIGALAFDGTRSVIWACVGEDIGQINPTTGAYTKAFTSSNGCIDGLAYDGTDDTIWASGDAESSIQHYSIAGASIGEHNFSGTELGEGCNLNSGIAVGGPTLYLATNGCSTIWQSTKDFATMSEFIGTAQTGDRRVEDMECDNITFASSGKTVMWSQDAYDNILTAYEIPAGSCGFGGLPPEVPVTPPVEEPVAAPAAALASAPHFTG